MSVRRNTQPAAKRGITVGLFADEGMPASVVQTVSDEAPAYLRDTLDNDVAWKVAHRVHTFALDEEGHIPMDDIAKQRRRLDWDVAILVTDLPRQVGNQPIVSDYNSKLRVALLSLPAVGAWQIRRRTRNVMIHLLGHLLENDIGNTRHRDTISHFRPVRHIHTDDAQADQHLALK